MKNLTALFVLLFVLTGCVKKPGNLVLSSLIGDNMVLQQKTDVIIRGKASPGYRVKISTEWNESGKAVTGGDGKWAVTIPTPGAGGPYTLSVSGKDTTISIKNVLIGEVWFCSGQSNMEMPMAGWPPVDTIMHSAVTLAGADLPGLRLFMVRRNVSAEPLDECTGSWQVCTPASASPFSATAFFFGAKLHRELGIPVGLIESAWGGTPVEAWMSGKVLSEAGEFTDQIESILESVPLVSEYQEWLNSHLVVETASTGQDQWKNLSFGDDEIPAPDFDDNGWPAMQLPGLFERVTGDFDGAIWFRKKVDITADMTGKPLILSLGPIDDMDRTYLNGEMVGSHEVTGVYQAERNYEIPADLVKPGVNVIAVRVIDNQGGGGIWGEPGSMKITELSGSRKMIPLDGEWKYQPVAELSGNKFFVLNPAINEFTQRKRPVIPGAYSPTTLFNAMVAPVVSYPVKGAIWYQGEANVGRADQYSKIFPLMIRDWRESWGSDYFPFYFAQIAPYVYSGRDSTESAFLREAQESALKLPNTGMAVTLDIATVMNIHPPFKKEVGERLANLALKYDYGEEIIVYGPVFESLSAEGRSLRIKFNNTEGGLTAKGGRLTEFELAGRDGKYVKADARIDENEVIVSSPLVNEPVSVRYCWRNGAEASLFNGAGLPAHQFRYEE